MNPKKTGKTESPVEPAAAQNESNYLAGSPKLELVGTINGYDQADERGSADTGTADEESAEDFAAACARVSAKALARFWDTPEEDAAWARLKEGM